MSSAFLITHAANHLKSTYAHVASGAWIGSLPGLIPDDEPKPEIANRRNLPESAHFNGGKQRQMVPVTFLRECDGTPQHIWRKMHVRIRKNNPFAARLFEPRDQGVRF